MKLLISLKNVMVLSLVLFLAGPSFAGRLKAPPKDFRLSVLPLGTESRTGRDESGDSVLSTSTSLALGLAWRQHQFWLGNYGTQKNESSNGSLSIKSEAKEVFANYRYVYYQPSDYLVLSVGGGLLLRQQSVVNQLPGLTVVDRAKDQIMPEFLVGLGGNLSILYYDLGLKTIFQNDEATRTAFAMSARAGVSFRF